MSVFHHQPGLVQYPRMERQDLTQSQLGSFKFIPTDVVTNNQYTMPSLEQQWLQSKRNSTPVNTSFSPSTIRPRRSHLSRRRDIFPRDSDTIEDVTGLPSMYEANQVALNQFALPDSTPTSPISPTKPVTRAYNVPINSRRNRMRPSAQTYIPSHLQESSDANTSASTSLFLPPISEVGDDGTIDLQTSLLRALATEQNAHNSTKAEFKKLYARHIELEAQLKHTEIQNRSLLGSVSMLKSLVQHSVKREQDREVETKVVSKVANPLPDYMNHETLEQMIKDAAAKASASLVAEQRMDSDRNSIGSHFNTTVDALWNFDALEDDILNHKVSSKDTVPDWRSGEQKDRLIDVSPEQPYRASILGTDSAVSALKDAATLNSLPNGLAKKPADVVPEHASSVKSSTQGFGAQRPTVQMFDASTSRATPMGCISGAADGTNAKCMAMPYDPDINWKITALNPIFDGDADRYDRLGPAMKPENRNSYFYEYPVRYTPSKGEKNLYRTVMVDFLPQDTDYFMLLELIRGGAIESIQLFDPFRGCTTFKTARVVFTYELGARTMYMQGQNPGLYVGGQRVRVWQVLQPTYPVNRKLELDIFEKGCTRLLIMDNASEEAVMKLPSKLQEFIRFDLLIEIARAYDGLPIVEFTSVEAAVKAMNQLIHDPDLAGVSFDFEADQCEAAYAD